MEVRNRIWEELKQAVVNKDCILRYNSRHRRYNRLYETFIAFTASAGAFGYIINTILPLISTILIGIVSVTKAIFPSLIQKEEELSDLDKISDFYTKYLNDLEKLFYQFDNKIINENEAADLFFKIKDKEIEQQTKMNKLIRRISSKEQSILNQMSEDYLNKVYFNNYHKNANNS